MEQRFALTGEVWCEFWKLRASSAFWCLSAEPGLAVLKEGAEALQKHPVSSLCRSVHGVTGLFQ